MPLRHPYIVGCDVAGTVVTCGLGIRRFSEGDRVWGSNQGLFGRQGTFAEYVVIDEKWLYPVPQGQSDAEAAAGAMIGLTTSLALFHSARLRRGEVVFVHGGRGRAGWAALQQAKAAGACVIMAPASSSEREYFKDVPADLVLDRQSATFEQDVCEFIAPRGGIDVWLELEPAPSLNFPLRMMAEGGRIVLTEEQKSELDLPVRELQNNRLSILGTTLFTALPDLQRRYAQDLNSRYTYGSWRPCIGASFSLSQAVEAHQLQESISSGKSTDVIGKIVVIPES
jgi:NADPH2:quinone reductase